MRISIACALFQQPNVLLLDEPTNHLVSLSLTHSLTIRHSLTHSLSHSLYVIHSLTHSIYVIHSLAHSLTHSLTHSLYVIHSLTHSLSHSLTQSLSHSPTHFVTQLDMWCSEPAIAATPLYVQGGGGPPFYCLPYGCVTVTTSVCMHVIACDY
jgi:ABC-type methionine transport system ATPase subunit